MSKSHKVAMLGTGLIGMFYTMSLHGQRGRDQVAVIDDNTRKTLFPNTPSPVGEVLLLGSVPVRVIGVAAKSDSAFGNSEALNVFVPYTTARTTCAPSPCACATTRPPTPPSKASTSCWSGATGARTSSC